METRGANRATGGCSSGMDLPAILAPTMLLMLCGMRGKGTMTLCTDALLQLPSPSVGSVAVLVQQRSLGL